jgi:hypothetical protein
MGTITRSFANNITTSGVLLPASLTNNSIANVTAYNAAVATGGMVLVSSATASASATIDFTLGSYKEYQFYFINIHPSVDDTDFQMNFSTDSGSNYNVTKTTTYFRSIHNESDVTALLEYESANDLAQSTAFKTLCDDIGSDSDQNANGIFHLFNPASTTYVKHFISKIAVSQSANYAMDLNTAGYANTTSALTNIRFKMSSGNIDDGTILMFGIV